MYGSQTVGACNAAVCVSLWTRLTENFLERPSKFNIEDGVNDRIQETVNVTEPDEEREQDLVEMTDASVFEQVVSDAYCVDDVDRKERNPAEHENTWMNAKKNML